MEKFYSNGKLLITGEYVVLDGATALAVPTSFGQSLKIDAIEEPYIHWRSLDCNGDIWFEESFRAEKGYFKGASNLTGENIKVKERLKSILKEADKLNPQILTTCTGFAVTTKLDFPQNWGLGSSSTLINNIAQWFNIDAYQLLKNTFGGSGYDIASAQNKVPLTYSITKSGRTVLTTGFDPAFKEEIFFVHLNRKQSSRESIAHYEDQPKDRLGEAIEKISTLTYQIISSETISEFELLLEIHETIISQLIKTPKIKTQLFPNYPRAIKSLGGWGGDFILATGGEKEKDYFRSKGHEIIISYSEMVL